MTTSSLHSPEIASAQFRQCIQQTLGAAPEIIEADGRIHRFADDPNRPASKAGWYVIHLHPSPHGAFGTHRDSEIHAWSIGDNTAPQTAAEIEAAQRGRIEKDLLTNRLRADAASKASELLAAAVETGSHDYLLRKQIGAGLVTDDKLLVPLSDGTTSIINAQAIHTDGTKLFMPGGRVKGCFHVIGSIEKAPRILLCEGYATGRTLHLATSLPTVCAMNCGNLAAVAERLLAIAPKAGLMVCADNDAWTNGNPGVTHGLETARRHKARFTVPVFTNPTKGQTDFNDLHVAEGLDAVTRQIEQAWHGEVLKFSEADVVGRLASLPPADYTRERPTWKEYLNCKLSHLDALVEAARATNTPATAAELEPWDNDVDTGELLDGLVALVKRHILLTDHEAVAWALWVAHSYVYEKAQCLTPILNITSATKRCGKSQLLTLTARVVSRPKFSAGISGPAIYRTIELMRPTLLVDEADNTVSKDKMDLLSVLNAGISPDAVVTKCTGEDLTPTDFSCYCAKVLAGIGCRIDTLEDRSIPITLRRKSKDVSVERVRRVKPEDIRRKLLRWAADNASEIATSYANERSHLPDGLNDRQQDCVEILLCVADLAGGDWSVRARTAFITIFGALDAVQSLPEMLLADLYLYHTTSHATAALSAKLVEWLNGLEERPWRDFKKGRGLDQRRLAELLRGFGLHSKEVRTPDGKGKGYAFDQFEDVFVAYADSAATKRDNATSPANIDDGRRGPVADVADDADERDKRDTSATPKPNDDGPCRVVADCRGENGEETETELFRV
jgi:putative DNA primase/helicase